jgi:hypothetical protein
LAMTTAPISRRIAAALAALALMAAGCSQTDGGPTQTSGATGGPSGSPLPAAFGSGAPYAPAIDPADFVGQVDNPYFPLASGTQWVYRGARGAAGEVDTVTVTGATTEILGVNCIVVKDEVTDDGELIESTFDWYAQDADGNVWYFGEDTAEYENGKVTSREGSWKAGVDGAQPGIIMPASPQVGATYREEYYAGHAEDLAKVTDLDVSAVVPLGSYDHVLVTRNWSPLEPDLVERKFYAPDVGFVMEDSLRGGTDVVKLVQLTH